MSPAAGRLVRLLAHLRAVALMTLLVAAIGLGGAVVIDRAAPPPAPSTSPEATIVPAPTAVARIEMPLGDECLGCHRASSGVGVARNPVPVIAHPLDGWSACTECHADHRLVRQAPGHAGIAAANCTDCHVTATAAAPDRPHASASETGCLTCHGSSALLPASMATRSETTCWLCHRAPAVTPPAVLHPLAADVVCRSCHVAGEVGALSASHAAWSEATCLVCHPISSGVAPIAPHELDARIGRCSLCHAGPTAPPPGARR